MKKIFNFIAIIAIAATLLATGACHSSQNKSTEDAYRDSMAFIVANTLIENRDFVLTANRITIGNSPSIQVFDSSNFILVDGDKCTIQLSPRTGVGYFTAVGTASGYKARMTKNGDVLLQFHFIGKLGTADVSLTLYKNGNSAMAYVDATFGRGRTAFYGEIKPTKRTTIQINK